MVKSVKKVIKVTLDHQDYKDQLEYVVKMERAVKKVCKELQANLVHVAVLDQVDHLVLMVHQDFPEFLVELDNLVDLDCQANLEDRVTWVRKANQAKMENAVFLEKMVFQAKMGGWECQVKMETVVKLVQADHKDHPATTVMMEFLGAVVDPVKMVFQVHLEPVDQMVSLDPMVKRLLDQLE